MSGSIRYNPAHRVWSPISLKGCIAYEMLEGDPPFRSKLGAKDLFRKIMTERVKMPVGSTSAAHKLLKGLLNRNPHQRWGVSKSTMFEVGGVAQLQQAAFFEGLDWDKLERKEVDPPDIFEVADDNDTRHFHDEFTGMTLPRSVMIMAQDEYKPRHVTSDCFRGFSFIQEDFCLPERDEDEVKNYWNSEQGDCESESECASSKCDSDQVPLANTNPEKKKRPPRRRKKKKDVIEPVASTEPVSEKDSSQDHKAISVAALSSGVNALCVECLSAEDVNEHQTLGSEANKLSNVDERSVLSAAAHQSSSGAEAWVEATGKSLKSSSPPTSNPWVTAADRKGTRKDPAPVLTAKDHDNRSAWAMGTSQQPRLRSTPAAQTLQQGWPIKAHVPPPPSHAAAASPSASWTQHRMSPRRSPHARSHILQTSSLIMAPSWPSLDPPLPSKKGKIPDQPPARKLQGAWAKR